MNIINVQNDSQITFGKTPKTVQARALKVLSHQQLKEIKDRYDFVNKTWRVRDEFHGDMLESVLLSKKISSKPALLLMLDNLRTIRGNIFTLKPQEIYYQKKNPSSKIIEEIPGTWFCTPRKEASIIEWSFKRTLKEAYGNKYTSKEKSIMIAKLFDILGDSFKKRDRVQFAEQATACKNAAAMMRKS